MMKAMWRRELNIRSLGFSHDRPEQFVRCQWQKNTQISITYLVYRWAFAIFFLSVWVWSFFSAAQQNTPAENFLSKWPIYLTNWGYTLCTLQALLAVGLIIQQLIKERRTDSLGSIRLPNQGHNLYLCHKCTQDRLVELDSKDTVGFTEDHVQMPVIYKVYWLLHTLAVVIAIGITGSYFVVDYNPAVHTLTALNLLMHAFNAILMVLDVLVVAHPFRLLHFCWSLLFIFTYFCFSVIYHHAGGTGKNNAPSIYPALDWNKIQSTLPIAVLGMLAVIFAHFCIWLTVIIRKQIAGSNDDACEELKISKPSSNQVQPLEVNTP